MSLSLCFSDILHQAAQNSKLTIIFLSTLNMYSIAFWIPNFCCKVNHLLLSKPRVFFFAFNFSSLAIPSLFVCVCVCVYLVYMCFCVCLVFSSCLGWASWILSVISFNQFSPTQPFSLQIFYFVLFFWTPITWILELLTISCISLLHLFNSLSRLVLHLFYSLLICLWIH